MVEAEKQDGQGAGVLWRGRPSRPAVKLYNLTTPLNYGPSALLHLAVLFFTHDYHLTYYLFHPPLLQSSSEAQEGKEKKRRRRGRGEKREEWRKEGWWKDLRSVDFLEGEEGGNEEGD